MIRGSGRIAMTFHLSSGIQIIPAIGMTGHRPRRKAAFAPAKTYKRSG
jgi:hypothetical protein